MIKKFRRIISSGTFIPEIDGLRFIAITSVFFYHLSEFLRVKDKNDYLINFNIDFLNEILSVGYFGVQLFFVISGYILSRPFANMYLNNGPKVKIKKYFLRRVTRLEPPYLLVMSLLLFASVYIVEKLSLYDALFSYLCSILYVHTFFYDVYPLLNGVAWSLEIEIQFYILMPLLALVYKIRNKKNRRLFILFLIVFTPIFNWIEIFDFISILKYIHYFLIGMLLVDYSFGEENNKRNIKHIALLSTISFISIWIIEICIKYNRNYKIFFEIFQMVPIFFFYYFALIQKSVKFLKVPIITTIGGMCYTIYLIHYPLISAFGNPLMKINFSNYSVLNTFLYSIILTFICIAASSLFFLFIERPCMDKDWIKKIFKKFRLGI
jgi:peptidoglycan/LPS O-acetylase OafA/YrhL